MEMIMILAILVIPFGVLILVHVLSQGKEMCGQATVVSRRLELGSGGGQYGDNWNRLVTFRLSGGSELELYATREDYEQLTEGTSGLLTWQKENLLHFDSNTQ